MNIYIQTFSNSPLFNSRLNFVILECPISTSIACPIWLPISENPPSYLVKAAIQRDICYEPEEIDNAPLREKGRKELPFPDVYDGKECKKLLSAEDLPEFKTRYLKKQMELIITVDVLTYDTKGAGRKGITFRLYKDAPVVNVASEQDSDRSPSKRRVQACDDHGGAAVKKSE